MANYEQSSAYSNGRRPLGGAGEQGYGYSHEQYNVSIDDENINSANHEYGTRYASSTLTIADFLTRVESIKKEIESLSSNISAIASLHQRTISSTDSASTSAALESVISQTQILITRIRDQIKYLETDVAQSGGNTIKQSQIRSLRRQFKNRIEQYQQEEQIYKKRYQEQIARHYRVIHPEADEAEIQEAITADWGNEGVFQTALKSNRTGAAAAVLGTVRARHNDIQNIERTVEELNLLIEDLNNAIAMQEPLVNSAEQHTENVLQNTERANNKLTTAVGSSRRARKLRWVCCIIALVLLIAIAIAIILVGKFVFHWF